LPVTNTLAYCEKSKAVKSFMTLSPGAPNLKKTVLRFFHYYYLTTDGEAFWAPYYKKFYVHTLRIFVISSSFLSLACFSSLVQQTVELSIKIRKSRTKKSFITLATAFLGPILQNFSRTQLHFGRLQPCLQILD
jgi:N-glycosylase/DNA lyase